MGGGGGRFKGGQVGCKRRIIEVFVKIQEIKKIYISGGSGQGRLGVGCERRIEVFCENSKKKSGGGGAVGLGSVGCGDQGGSERRIKVFVKFKQFKKNRGGGCQVGVGLFFFGGGGSGWM